MISNTTFADLTGCAAQCSFAQSVSAPSACFPSLVYVGKRVDALTCDPPSAGDQPFNWNTTNCGDWTLTTGWTLVPPTSIDSKQDPCSADWRTVRRNSFFQMKGKEKKKKKLKKEKQKNLKQIF